MALLWLCLRTFSSSYEAKECATWNVCPLPGLTFGSTASIPCTHFRAFTSLFLGSVLHWEWALAVGPGFWIWAPLRHLGPQNLGGSRRITICRGVDNHRITIFRGAKLACGSGCLWVHGALGGAGQSLGEKKGGAALGRWSLCHQSPTRNSAGNLLALKPQVSLRDLKVCC